MRITVCGFILVVCALTYAQSKVSRRLSTDPPMDILPECTEASLQCVKPTIKDIGQYLCDMYTAAKESNCGCDIQCSGDRDGNYHYKLLNHTEGTCNNIRIVQGCVILYPRSWDPKRKCNPAKARAYFEKVQNSLIGCQGTKLDSNPPTKSVPQCTQASLQCVKPTFKHIGQFLCDMYTAADASACGCGKPLCDVKNWLTPVRHGRLVDNAKATCNNLRVVQDCINRKTKECKPAKTRVYYDELLSGLTKCQGTKPGKEVQVKEDPGVARFSTDPPSKSVPECTEASLQCAKSQFKDIGQFLCDMYTVAQSKEARACSCDVYCYVKETSKYHAKLVDNAEATCNNLRLVQECTTRLDKPWCEPAKIRAYYNKLLCSLTECQARKPGKALQGKGDAGAILGDSIFVSVSAILVTVMTF